MSVCDKVCKLNVSTDNCLVLSDPIHKDLKLLMLCESRAIRMHLNISILLAEENKTFQVYLRKSLFGNVFFDILLLYS